MTQIVLTASSFLLSPIEVIINFFRAIGRKLEENREYRQTLRELSLLSNRELNDIGMTRGDIYSVARGEWDVRRGIKHIDHEVESNPNLKGWS